MPDARVLAFLGSTGVLTGIGFGLVPALRATCIDLAPSLQGASRGTSAPDRQRLSHALVIGQVSLSLVLLIGAGLLIRSLDNLHRIDWGFQPEHVVIFDVAHNPQNREPAALAQVARQVQQRVTEVPGVATASVSGIMLFSPSDISAAVTIRDYTPSPTERVTARYNAVSAGYFETLGMTVISGRSIQTRDVQNGTPVAVINESMARRYFAGAPSVGRTMQLSGAANAGKSLEVVGVVRDAKYNNLREDAKPMFYVPFTQIPRALRSVEVRTTQPMAALVPAIRQALTDVSKDIMIRRVVTLSNQVDQSLAAERLIMRLCSFFGALALVLACVGLYGVMAYSVTQRTREIGIRMALGASGGSIFRLVFRDTTGIVLTGVAIGVPLALVCTRLVSTFLYGLTTTDPVTMALATMLLLAAIALASYLPARRAAAIEPTIALRYD
jgi:predicted permease